MKFIYPLLLAWYVIAPPNAPQRNFSEPISETERNIIIADRALEILVFRFSRFFESKERDLQSVKIHHQHLKEDEKKELELIVHQELKEKTAALKKLKKRIPKSGEKFIAVRENIADLLSLKHGNSPHGKYVASTAIRKSSDWYAALIQEVLTSIDLTPEEELGPLPLLSDDASEQEFIDSIPEIKANRQKADKLLEDLKTEVSGFIEDKDHPLKKDALWEKSPKTAWAFRKRLFDGPNKLLPFRENIAEIVSLNHQGSFIGEFLSSVVTLRITQWYVDLVREILYTDNFDTPCLDDK